MKIIYARNKEEIQEWDNYVINNIKGNHLVLSDWLESFKSYGFDKEIIFLKNDNRIIGGLGAVIAKFSFFKFYIIPYGPIVDENYDNLLSLLIKESTKSAKSKACCYYQISIPKSNSEFLREFSYSLNFSIDKDYKQGKLFKYIYSANGVNFVDLKEYNPESADKLLMSYSSNTRRHIRKALANIDEIKPAKSKEEIKIAYELCLINARNSNYSVRSWNDIKEVLYKTINENKGLFLVAVKDDKVIGSGFFLKSGRHLTYLFGGTIKTSHNISSGYALHWEAIKKSLELGYKWYNISLGGSEGVKEFKSKFNTKEIHYEEGHYHLILNSFKFKIFLVFEQRIKSYKSIIAKWLSYLK